jgi:sugar phosphate permease
MLIDISNARGRTLAFNGVCGNLGAALAAGATAIIAAWIGWRGAFLVPAAICVASGFAFLALVPDDRHRTGKRASVAHVRFSPVVALSIFALFMVISLAAGLTFNSISVALPKIVDERLGGDVSLIAVGGLATAIFMCGAVAQLAMGRVVERVAPHLVFAAVVTLQFAGIAWAATASGPALLAAMAVTMAAIYAQVTVGDIVIARYTADAWRGRIYAVRYFLTFVSSGAAVAAIAFLHSRGGFDLVLAVIAVIAGVLLAAVIGFVILAAGAESRTAAQPAE